MAGRAFAQVRRYKRMRLICATTGGVTLETLKRYVENQKGQ